MDSLYPAFTEALFAYSFSSLDKWLCEQIS